MSELITTIPAIIVISYLVGMTAKASPVPDKFIPVIVGAAGGLLGIAGLYCIPDFPAGDIINALAVGIASGLASTGANQIVKQLQRGEEE